MSAHQPKPLIVVRGDLSTGRTKPLGELGFALPMLGAAKREQFSAVFNERSPKGAGRISEVQKFCRAFNEAPGSLVHRTERVQACKHGSRVSFGGIQSNFPSMRRFRSQEPTKGTSAWVTADGSDPTSYGASR